MQVSTVQIIRSTDKVGDLMKKLEVAKTEWNGEQMSKPRMGHSESAVRHNIEVAFRPQDFLQVYFSI